MRPAQVVSSILRNLSWRADINSKKVLREVGSMTALMQCVLRASKVGAGWGRGQGWGWGWGRGHSAQAREEAAAGPPSADRGAGRCGRGERPISGVKPGGALRTGARTRDSSPTPLRPRAGRRLMFYFHRKRLGCLSRRLLVHTWAGPAAPPTR